jgi:uncharacterized membrane protein YfcA
MSFHDLTIIIIAFLSETLGTISGFGSSTFFVPTAIFFESIQFVLALTAILHCFGNSFKIFLFRKYFNFHHFWKLAVPSIVFTGIGAILTHSISMSGFQKGLGILLIIIPFVMFFKKNIKVKLPIYIGVVLSAISGFLTGLLGTGGAIRGLVLSTMGLEKNAFVVLSSSIDFGGDFLRAFIYIKNGYMDWSQWHYIPLLAVAAYLGAKLGKWSLQKINQQMFEKIVMVFIIISGVLMLF